MMAAKTVNAQIDALLKRRGNPAKNPAPSSARAGTHIFVATRSKQKALDHAAMSMGINRGIAVKAKGGYEVYQAYQDKPAPAKNPRSVTLVAAKNPAKPPTFVVETKSGAAWAYRAGFLKREHATQYARAIAVQLKDTPVRVIKYSVGIAK